jgi:hypothetical protein
MRKLMFLAPALLGVVTIAQQPATQLPGAPPAVPPALPALVPVKAIDPPETALPPESASAAVKKFSFIAYGDTRSGSDPAVPGDAQVVNATHSLLVDAMLAKVQERAKTPFPIRFVVQSGDAVLRGVNGTMWNVGFTPVIEKLTRANVPYFFSVGNHDVTGMPQGDPGRAQGLSNALSAMAKLIPPEGSPRRLSGYPTYAFGYGNTFVFAIDSNVASDAKQLAWVTEQLAGLDRARYEHVVAVFHHPLFSSGPHGGHVIEAPTAALRAQYVPLFRRHHVRLVITGHDHLLDHWVERYEDRGRVYRRDDIVTGGGGAPLYGYDSEPVLTDYLAAGASSKVTVEHLMRPGLSAADNPHHFLIVEVDGPRLTLEVVALGDRPYAPYAGQSRIVMGDKGS